MKWLRITTPCGPAIADFYVRGGYMLVPRVKARDGAFFVTRVDVYVPHSLTGEPVYWATKWSRDGKLDHALGLAKREAQAYARRCAERDAQGLAL